MFFKILRLLLIKFEIVWVKLFSKKLFFSKRVFSSGTACSAAAVGVPALKSATKSNNVKSVS